MKAWYGKAATKENDWAYDWLPKLDKLYDVLQVFDLMYQGKINGYVCQGFNPLAAVPNKEKLVEGLSKLKFLVIIDPLATETSDFWQNHGELNEVDPAKIQTEVFRLPSSCFAEEDGSLDRLRPLAAVALEGRRAAGRGEGGSEIIARALHAVRALYQKEGGTFPDPILNLTWDYKIATKPSPDELAREFNGKALADVPDPKDPTKIARQGGRAARRRSAHLRDDGTTACGNWIYSGAYTQAGNMMARRDTSDPSGLGLYPGWAFSWPANRRILYNRASCDPSGKPWDPKRKLVWWNGTKWVGDDVPDMRPDAKPEEDVGPFIMNPEGVGRLFGARPMPDGPFPEHYEPFESPTANPLHPKVGPNPAARIFQGQGEPRQGRGVPLRRDDVPAHRALPLLDEARARARGAPARAVRRDRRGAREEEGHPERRRGRGAVEARRDRREGGRDEADQAAHRERQGGPHRRDPHPLGLRRHRQARLPGEHAHPVRRRRQRPDAGVQGVPRERREGSAGVA